MAQALTTTIFAVHILGGAVAMVAGLTAVCARKGGRLHRTAGDVFVVSMVIMAIFAAVLGVIRPGQIINVFIAGLTLYLVVTAWLTARRRNAVPSAPEAISLMVSLALCAPFALVIFQIVTGVRVFKTALKIEGPILIALSLFAAIIAAAAIGDLRVVLGRRLSGTPRIARHLWRMCFGLALSLGSGFTNGFARLLPGPYHVPPAFLAPQLLMLVVLLYWLVRVRFPGWAGKGAASPSRLAALP
ncbi:MAG: DUF2306 domain-containing protein [Caulobacteraceae bacterium]|nr:DUF2306 domain-containing protein [Caulobacteraceae bacterium]